MLVQICHFVLLHTYTPTCVHVILAYINALMHTLWPVVCAAFIYTRTIVLHYGVAFVVFLLARGPLNMVIAYFCECIEAWPRTWMGY